MKPYYSHAGITIYHGDCREILPTLPPVDLLLTDPPYGINLNNDWQNDIHYKRGSALNVGTGAIANDAGEITHKMFTRHPRRIVFGFPYLSDPDATGWLVWDKEPGFNGRSLTSPVEMAYTTTWRGFKAIRLLWSGYMRASGSETKVGHPTQKPLKVFTRLLEWHPDDNSILDPFMGSGTTLIAAKQLGRRAIGIELEERYCETAAKRLSQECLFAAEPEPEPTPQSATLFEEAA